MLVLLQKVDIMFEINSIVWDVICAESSHRSVLQSKFSSFENKTFEISVGAVVRKFLVRK